jgi:hypothetical protein
MIEITIDRNRLTGTINLIGADGDAQSVENGDVLLAERDPRSDLAPDPALPADTRLWATLQNASGGTWGGCVFDVDAITGRLDGISLKSI